MTVTELHERLGALIDEGAGDNEVLLRMDVKVSDRRKRSGYRVDDFFGILKYACGGQTKAGDMRGTELWGQARHSLINGRHRKY